MNILYEFRVNSRFAHRLFSQNEGRDLGSIRLVQLRPDDSRLSQLGDLQTELMQETDFSFFYGWRIIRKYSKLEIDSAAVLTLESASTFEPPGESCGTEYDETRCCPACGAGAPQVSSLRLDLRKVPKRNDIGRSIAGELIVSQRMAEVLLESRLRGVELTLVRHKARYEDDPFRLEDTPSGRLALKKAANEGVPQDSWELQVWLNRIENRSLLDEARAQTTSMKRRDARSRSQRPPTWYQLRPAGTARILPPTRTGVNPLDEDPNNEYRCPHGDTIGLNLLSELWVSKEDFMRCDSDIVHTEHYIGSRMGLLRPERQIIISQRLFGLLKARGIKGFRAEVAHLV